MSGGFVTRTALMSNDAGGEVAAGCARKVPFRNKVLMVIPVAGIDHGLRRRISSESNVSTFVDRHDADRGGDSDEDTSIVNPARSSLRDRAVSDES